MTVTVAGKNYTQISNCNTSTSGGTWATLTTPDTDNFKEGTASLSGTVKNAGANTVTFTPTGSVDLSGTKHVRWWMILNQGGKLSTFAGGGLQFWCTDGGNTGYWKVSGRDTYPGGWMNFVLDVSRAVDSGTKPTNMNAITSMGFTITLDSAAKNAVNTWVDNLCVCDGLTAYGDDAGGYFDLDDIYAVDNDPTNGGWGIIRKIGGVFFMDGSLDIGFSGSATKFNAKSQVLVFEDRLVSTTLYGITVADDGTNTTEFILGSKAGTAGVEGCMIRVESASQTPKFFIDGRTDTDVNNFKLYGSTFYDSAYLKFPDQPSGVATVHRARSSNVATLGVNGHGLIVGNTVEVTGLGGTGYNGTWTVASVPDANHFTYANTGTDEGETADTGGTSTSLNVEVISCNFESCDEVQATTCVITSSNFVSANDEAVILPSGNTHNLTDCFFINCPYGVRIPNTGTYTFSGLRFVNNTYDIDNTSGGSVTISAVLLANPTTYTGSTTINNDKIIKVTCIDEASDPITGAVVVIEKAADGSLVLQDTTDGFGVVEGTYNYVSDTPVYIWTRKSSPGTTRYINGSALQTIKDTGLDTTMTLRVDLNT